MRRFNWVAMPPLNQKFPPNLNRPIRLHDAGRARNLLEITQRVKKLTTSSVIIPVVKISHSNSLLINQLVVYLENVHF